MTDESRHILSDPALVAAQDAHFERLQALFGGERLETAFVLCGVLGNSSAGMYAEPDRWIDGALHDLADKAEALLDPLVFRPLAVEPGIYGVHFIDMLFGADVFPLDDNWQVHPLHQPVGELPPLTLSSDPTWALARRLAKAFIAADVPLPLFGLPTLSSALNIGINLYGQELLVAMHADPEAAHRDLQTINDLLCRLHRWYLRTLPTDQLQPVVAAFRTQPPGFGQLCGCSTQLLSPEMYRDFIAPLDDQLLSVYPHGGMIHLCGAHTQHLPVWREMRSLRSVQLNDRAVEDLEAYFQGLREDQIIYANACETMPVERIMEITGGRRVVVVADTTRFADKELRELIAVRTRKA
jgi:hypothetical protein